MSMPGASRPDGESVCVEVAPKAAALAFILSTVACRPPSRWARVLAASLPDSNSAASSSSRAV
ncbi:Uncharacterised protein [Mycobacteroides abscessus subsp. abscessus]|nr:Uncharacterised protein [Mycobacteroides abscessus subsp. abscessus]SIB19714.1 Uncharacterised protein [Mycobacteroides abscessus subsp. abscessus]SIL13960.1 Uncharacterised protein [Mycobacteroides abscessus subsp. abscessus]